jgi:hypothetical protein
VLQLIKTPGSNGSSGSSSGSNGPAAGQGKEWGEFLHAPGKVFYDFDRCGRGGGSLLCVCVCGGVLCVNVGREWGGWVGGGWVGLWSGTLDNIAASPFFLAL